MIVRTLHGGMRVGHISGNSPGGKVGPFREQLPRVRRIGLPSTARARYRMPSNINHRLCAEERICQAVLRSTFCVAAHMELEPDLFGWLRSASRASKFPMTAASQLGEGAR